ncbi:hypothetical protein [[Clostridium] innocuum]|uniref:hypothetical protein n=1 Tax=Clostridium innocuum TaxID=1522 RepID=UPI0032D39583
MNKYQEALNRILDDDYDFPHDFYGEDKATTKERDADIMQELVDRATPKRPVTKGGYTDFKCPVCGRRVRSGKGSSSRQKDNVCQRCFQVLDWSDVI